MTHKLECGIVEEMRHISACTGIEVVDANDLAALVQQPLAEVRAQEPCPSSNDDSLLSVLAQCVSFQSVVKLGESLLHFQSRIEDMPKHRLIEMTVVQAAQVT